jgi:Ser/Thr protein kinase RdoA (MazF antagonist)
VQRGFITAVVVDKHVGDLKTYVVHKKRPPLEKGTFMEALGSVIPHLNVLRLTHNDVNPRNIFVNTSSLPVLADFDSCRPVG